MAYCPTILSQMLKLFSRYDFEKLVSKHRAGFHARGVRSWSQCVALLFSQFAGQDQTASSSFGSRAVQTGMFAILKVCWGCNCWMNNRVGK